MLVFAAILSSFAYAAPLSIANERVNNQFLSQNSINYMLPTDVFNTFTYLNSFSDINSVFVTSTLTELSTGTQISETTNSFPMKSGQNTIVLLILKLTSAMQQKTDFRLDITSFDTFGNADSRSYIIKFIRPNQPNIPNIPAGKTPKMAASIDRVLVNGQIMAPSRTNFIQKNTSFDVAVDIRALTDLENVHIGAILKDSRTGAVVADATPDFNLDNGVYSSSLLRIVLPAELQSSNKFTLIVQVTDQQGKAITEKVYGIAMDGALQPASGGSSSSGTFNSGFDISINRVSVNGDVVTESTTNVIQDANSYAVLVEFTSVGVLENGHVEAILRGRQSGLTVSDSSTVFNLGNNQSSAVALRLNLINALRREKDFDLTIRIVDDKGNVEQKVYPITVRTGFNSGAGGNLDLSIDRVRVNGQIVAVAQSNFIDDASTFAVLVDITALEDITNAHGEAILKDLRTGQVVSDATSNFNLAQDNSTTLGMNLNLLNGMKRDDSFELTIRIVDAQGNSVQKIYGLATKGHGANGAKGNGALDISIDTAELEKKTLAEEESNFVIISDSLKEANLKVRVTSLENIENAHIDAILTYGNGDSVSDATLNFNIDDGQSVFKTLKLPLVPYFRENDFKLKIKVTDTEGDFVEKEYGLKLSRQQFPFFIDRLSTNPDESVEPGKNLQVSVDVGTYGLVPSKGLKLAVSIPELGISSIKFIDDKTSSLKDIKEEFTLKIPQNTDEGSYTVRAEVSSLFNNAETDSREVPINILTINNQLIQNGNDKLLIKVAVVNQDLKNDGGEVIYPIIFTNQGPSTKSYMLALDPSNWANLRLSESNVFVLKPGQTKTIYVYASAKDNFKGEQTFTAIVKTDGKILKQIPLKANVIESKKNSMFTMRDLLKYSLIAAVVLLVAFGIIVGMRDYTANNGEQPFDGSYTQIPDEEAGELYY